MFAMHYILAYRVFTCSSDVTFVSSAETWNQRIENYNFRAFMKIHVIVPEIDTRPQSRKREVADPCVELVEIVCDIRRCPTAGF